MGSARFLKKDVKTCLLLYEGSYVCHATVIKAAVSLTSFQISAICSMETIEHLIHSNLLSTGSDEMM